MARPATCRRRVTLLLVLVCAVCLTLVVRRRAFDAELAMQGREWRVFAAGVHAEEAPKPGGGRGLLVIGGGHYTLDALLTIAALRFVGCKLPVELWHDHDARLLGAAGTKVAAAIGASAGVTLRDSYELPGGSEVRGYQLKSHAMVNTAFEEVLYIDADNVAVSDPTPLFSTPSYVATGAVFWPDYRSYNPLNPMWQVVGRAPVPSMEMESGQMLVHRGRHRVPLALADYFNQRGPSYYYRFVHGDKDLFRFAWLALAAPFTMVATAVGSVGYVAPDGGFCGHSMLQYHPDKPSEAVFAHRNLRKWSAFPVDDVARWGAIKRGRLTVSEPASMPRVTPSAQCSCGSGHEPRHHCLDLDTPVDGSPASQGTLRKLAAIEQRLLRLRPQLVGTGASAGGLQPSWWVAWAASLASGAKL